MTMKTKENKNTMAAAAPLDDYAEKPTFPQRLTAQVEVVEDTELADTALADAVSVANSLADNLDKLANSVREGARQHLMQSISLGCLLDKLQQECFKKRVNFTALFADAKDDAKRKAALEAVGGHGLNMTYRTGNNYNKLFKGVYTRMISSGDKSREELDRILQDHAAGLASGEDMGALWAPYVTSSSLRQAYLELAPEQPRLTLGETLDNAAQKPAPFASWEEQRANLCAKFGGIFSNLDTYIAEMSRYTTPEDRLAQAEQLEDAAKKLRATKTQPDLPAITPAK